MSNLVLRPARRDDRSAIARRAIVPHPMLRYADGDALLLVKSIKPAVARPHVALADASAPGHIRARTDLPAPVLEPAA